MTLHTKDDPKHGQHIANPPAEKYTAMSGTAFLSGIQALVRLPIMQKLRDEQAGLNTAGFVTGYRGSPLGGLDDELWRAKKFLEGAKVKFAPAVNEDLAVTAVWGTQQVALVGETTVDGVFALWYGKGPGVDRSADAIKHLNYAGTSQYGGVILVAGDDHVAHSSSLPHQSDHVLIASMVPILYPCNVQEYLDLGLHAWAMSRFSGCAIGFKALADTVESSASVDINPFRIETKIPTDFVQPAGGMNIRMPDGGVSSHARAQEVLMQDYKIYAALAYARENRLNRITIGSADKPASLGIVASGKSYLDVLEALEQLGITEEQAEKIGIRVYKIAMPWPLEPDGIREFSKGLDEILVVEEKRQIVEYQLKEQLYNWRDDVRPRVIGKFDEKGEWVAPRGDWLLSPKGDFSIAQVAKVIAARIERFYVSDAIKQRVAIIDAKEAILTQTVPTPQRPPYYCSGCPHNTSTHVPEGSLALAGIGCHAMATAIYPTENRLMTHMGGEGATWIGQAAFSKVPHVFQNLGDGTYFHSGYLAIRAAVAANVNITYKILYNDAVAMTGGQPVDGTVTVDSIAAQMASEGVKRIALVSEDITRHIDTGLPSIVTLHDRKEMDAVQRELRDFKGVSVIIYDQTCAAEKRRRRKKGQMEDPNQRLFINAAVCEGCGDCGEASNCVSLMPLETEFGRKRTIDQSLCNKDYSCVNGFCPSFVTVEGGKLRKSAAAKKDETAWPELPEPVIPSSAETYNIMINGIGGTGVIAVGAWLGIAAHLEGKAVSTLDMTGMAQKNGAVTSHIRIFDNSDKAAELHSQRIATGEADLVLGCDILTAAAHDAIAKMRVGRTHAVVNTHQQPTGVFAQQPDWQFPLESTKAFIEASVGGAVDFVDGTKLATALMGDAIATNVFMLGYAYQKGLIPVSAASLVKAIEAIGVAVASNVASFTWGRRAAHDLAAVQRVAAPTQTIAVTMPQTLETLIKKRADILTKYQNAAYAQRYLDLMDKVKAAENQLNNGQRLSTAVAKNAFKLMAYKDEYEVARLYIDGAFTKALEQQFEGDYTLKFHLAPPLFAKKDAKGHLIKKTYGSWMMRAFKILAKLKNLRGTKFDLFGYTAERQAERAMRDDYIARVLSLLPNLSNDNLTQAIDFASIPEKIRGFGHVKEKAIAKYWAGMK
ncbi:indolepyruvate ferredoxin oxidoreductase [Formosimonas limnophila]|uniref:Indolepyruvate ferredoxin oxidoreductase n=1 Tax=Formosimonas limnophila TaxID=1384487 RepID=A0A8J3CNV7_9BURK|nr:indolepyruvate ferredoxin oxidoreductase family protein [Formosimonas limnophila]GHA78243.1 indolepyruvate ferredoxin oxidoreductase [Formosimonas limnophila]